MIAKYLTSRIQSGPYNALMTELREDLEAAFPKLIHDEAINIMKDRGMGTNDFAEMLDVFPEGARRLLSQDSWPAETGFRVLDALGVSVDISINPR